METKSETKTILILSVGGTAEPLVKAIDIHKPDFVYFFCSGGKSGSVSAVDAPGDPCGNKTKSKCPKCGHEYYTGNPKGKAIVVQAGLKSEQYEIITVDDPDNLNDCYNVLTELSEKLRKTESNSQIIANYTGGTKTMSVAIALVAIMTQEWDLSLNKGPRSDIIKVRSGDYPVVVNKWQIFIKQSLQSVKSILENYDYAQAEELAAALLRHHPEPALQEKLLRIGRLCKAFDYWDKFEHIKAIDLLEVYGGVFPDYLIMLKKILGKTKNSGYEAVYDLINNAERRAKQKRYDDAIARLYRAAELFAQVRLEKIKGYKSNNLLLSDLDEKLQPEYAKLARPDGKLLLGLREDYELLNKLGDPIGRKFKENENKIIEALKARNLSILAHGTTPLREDEYKRISETLTEFIVQSAECVGLKIEFEQLPRLEIME